MEGYLWNKAIEGRSREQLDLLEDERLRSTVSCVYNKVPHYQETLKNKGIFPEDIKTREDIAKLPFTYKADLRAAYPFYMLAVPMDQVLRVHSSSGTTGRPTVVAYSRNDLAMWTDCIARNLAAVGIQPGHLIQNAYGYGLFTGGLAFQYGAEKIGAAVIPASVGQGLKQLSLLRDFKPDVLLCTPSFAASLLQIAREKKISLEELNLKAGIFGGEFWSESLRRKIEEGFGIKAYDTYGLSEVIGPGVAHECEVRDGLHINEDHFFPEIVDVETGEVLPAGELGELVLTSLTKEAMPILRYRTGDITRLIRGECPCGRSFIRMARTLGRVQDLIHVQQSKVFPVEIENILLQFPELYENYKIFLQDKNTQDNIEIWVEATNELRDSKPFATKIIAEIQNQLHIEAHIKLVPAGTFKKSEGKAKRVEIGSI